MNLYWVLLILCLVEVSVTARKTSNKKKSNTNLEEKARREEITDVLFDEGRIVGGQNAVLGQFPYMVLIITTINTNFTKCGGSLISTEWVLSAAHCVGGPSATYTLFFGFVTLPCEGSCVETVPVRVIAHENYNNPAKANNDIALFQLSPGVVKLGAANIAVIRLPSISESCLTYFGYNVTVSGWGDISNDSVINDNAPIELRFVDLRVLPNDVCITAYLPQEVTEKHICASSDNNKDSCQGDSGGPLVTRSSNGTYTQIGVVSFGKTCASGVPAVYVRVTSYLDWINKKTGIAMRP